MSDEANLFRLGGGVSPCRQQHFESIRVPNLTLQSNGASTYWEKSTLCFEHSKRRAFASHTEMGRLQNLGSAGYGVSLNRSDEWLAQAVVAQQCLPMKIGISGPALLIGVRARVIVSAGFEVHSSAERAA
jgi:hypothetical protein